MELTLALFALVVVLRFAGFGEFSRIGLCTVPLTLIAAVLGLWAGFQMFNI